MDDLMMEWLGEVVIVLRRLELMGELKVRRGLVLNCHFPPIALTVASQTTIRSKIKQKAEISVEHK